MPDQVRLSHALARYADATTRMKNQITGAYHLIQKSGGLTGFTKTYQVTQDGSPIQPPQKQELATRAYDVARDFVAATSAVIDATATKDYANTQTGANVVVDGQVLLENAPPTLLLSMEKALTDLRTFLSKLPTLPADDQWTYDEGQDAYVSDPTESTRVENVKEAVVLYPHSEKHPAQTALVENPKVVGVWTTTKYSGSVTRKDAVELERRAQVLLDAVKKALFEANSYVAEDRHPAADILNFVTHDILA